MHKQRVKKSVDSTFNEANNIMISMIFFYRNYACSVLYFCPLKTIIDACVIFQSVKLSFFSVFINARVEICFRLRFAYRSVANRNQVLITHPQPFDCNACVTF